MALNSDIYSIAEYVEDIKKKFIEDQSEETLMMSLFGYLGEVQSVSLQNSIIMASEYSNEGIPVKAKFEKNIITHAMSLGIDKIFATPAYINVYIYFPESYILDHMKANKFIYDKDIKIFLEEFEFHTDYDIIISRTQLSNGEYVYTGMYDMERINPISTITSPYLISIGRSVAANDTPMLILNTIIRQVEISTVYKKILSDNPIENKTINFDFESQIASFEVVSKEANNTYYLTPVYDGLYDQEAEYFCNYNFMDGNSIRIKFNRDSYTPKVNCDISINIKTTQGASGNFKYENKAGDLVYLESERFSYDGMYMLVHTLSESTDGINKKSIPDLKKIIPKEALSRGSITNTTDLHNFFNSIDSDTCKLYFYKKRDNQLERLYYAYIVLKDGNNIIPTNTIDINIMESSFNYISDNNYQIKPGALVEYTNRVGWVKDVLGPDTNDTFNYMIPFLCIVNKSPLYLSYFLTIIHNIKILEFSYINQNAKLQMIATTIKCNRNFFTERDNYRIKLDISQNITFDFGMTQEDDDGVVTCPNLRVYGLIYNTTKIDGNQPLRYIEATFESVTDDFNYTFNFDFKTDDVIDNNNHIKILNLHDIGTGEPDLGYLSDTIGFKIITFVKLDQEYGRNDMDSSIPGLAGFTLSNEYIALEGVDLFYNYTDIINSSVYTFVPDQPVMEENNELQFSIQKVPVVKSRYINTEQRLTLFLKELEKRRNYIEYSLQVLEDNFGIDFKFFNTYGPSNLFKVADKNLINRVNLSMSFRMQLISASDNIIKDNIITYIKEYMEDLNEISDLHMPNLITEITNKYREQLVYFEFIDINGYGPGYQHVYREESEEILGRVPEFLNINTLDDSSADINITIV